MSLCGKGGAAKCSSIERGWRGASTTYNHFISDTMTTTKKFTPAQVFRWIVLAIAIFFTMSAMGGFLLGTGLPDGKFLIVGCMACGIAAGAWGCWYYTGKPEKRTLILYVSLPGLCLVLYNAVYLTLCHVFWSAGYDLPIGAVATGKIAETKWLVPVSLAMAFALLAIMQYQHNKDTPSK